MAGKRPCPCCNEPYSDSQIRRHLKSQRERLARELANRFDNDEDNDKGAGVGVGVGAGNDERGDGAADGAIIEGEGDVGLGDEDVHMGAHPAAEMGPDDAGPAPANAPRADAPRGVIGDYAPIRGIVQNPPVIIDDRGELPEESDGSDDENENGEEGEPEYIEHDLPLNLDPLNEPRIADEEMRRILALELGGLAANKWDGMHAIYRPGTKILFASWPPAFIRIFRARHGLIFATDAVGRSDCPPKLLPSAASGFSRILRAPRQTAAQIEARIEAGSITRYGRVRLTEEDDRIRTAALIDKDPIARDDSFIKYDLVPDDDASEYSGSDHPYLEAQYDRLLDIYHLRFNNINGTRKEFLLGWVQVCETGALDAGLSQNPYVTFDMDQIVRLSPQMINMQTVVAVVGRLHITGHMGDS
ncbi:hypothetical protein FRC09_011065 [Ceratobasidium sp. 395]|nr:hypothetical protein FRC09_011065 [Ceratobasidium sp. 395]